MAISESQRWETVYKFTILFVVVVSLKRITCVSHARTARLPQIVPRANVNARCVMGNPEIVSIQLTSCH